MSRFQLSVLIVAVAACGGGPAQRSPSNAPGVANVEPAGADPDLTEPLVDGTLDAPAAEVRMSAVKLAIPAVPAFDLPPPNPDGSHSVKEMRVGGKQHLDGELTVKGVVTWAYDCVKAIRQPGMTDQAARRMIDRDPTLCERAKFYVGDTTDTPAEHSLWVVDVPRPYNKLELERIKKSDRTDPDRCEPTEKQTVCPPYKVGDRVEVTGTWKLSSPHNERNSDGLLVYKRMKNVTRRWASPGTGATTPTPPPTTIAPTPPPVQARPPGAEPLPSIAKVSRSKVRASLRDDSIRAANEGSRAYGQRQWETAIERYAHAVERWRENHGAWYGLAAAHAQRRDWVNAADAAAITVQLAPDVAMYHLMYGRYLYEKAIVLAREDQARRENKPPDEVEVDHSVINFEKPRMHLAGAMKLEPSLWRAHFLIGMIDQYGNRPKQAAESMSRALELGAYEPAPWIELAELYRAWDYTDQAIAVAEQGTLVITGHSDLWFEVGMAYDDKRLDDKAIAAFDKALDARRDNHRAQFARGQAYFRKRDYTKARRDLEVFSKSAGPSLEFFKQQASRMLMDIAAKQK